VHNSKLIIGSKSGQLCNRLFAFSHFIVNAIEHNYELYNPNFDEYCNYFKATSTDDFDNYSITSKNSPFNHLKRKNPTDDIPLWANAFYLSPFHKILTSRAEYDLDSNDFTKILDRNKLIIAYGWLFRDHRCFKKYASLLKKFFEPVKEHSEKVTETIASCREKKTTLVGIHIRRGDYKSFAEGRYYYDDSVYLSKMQQTKEILNGQGQDVTFLICSNEPIKNSFDSMDTFLSTGHFIEDLYSLANCDYLIGPPSTYSMWASFYGDVPLFQIKDSFHQVCLKNFQISNG
jgi:Glycosyl transferase family 11